MFPEIKNARPNQCTNAKVWAGGFGTAVGCSSWLAQFATTTGSRLRRTHAGAIQKHQLRRSRRGGRRGAKFDGLRFALSEPPILIISRQLSSIRHGFP